MKGVSRRLRFLEAYAVISSVVFVVLAFSGFTQTRQKFTEIDVERLNIRESNGQLVMVAANSKLMPDPIVNGKAWKTERPAGLLFYNGLGDENGGLIYGAVQGKNGQYGAYQGLSFDKYKQAQAMALVYNDHSGKYRTGLQIWDRPETPLDEILTRQDEIAKMPVGDASAAAKKELGEKNFSPTRLYVGKNDNRESEITLYDAAGKARIKMIVTPDGTPRLDFLNADGKPIYSLPPK